MHTERMTPAHEPSILSVTMPSKPHIGLLGRIAAGKDMLADWLVENRGYRKFSIGDQIRWIVNTIWPNGMDLSRRDPAAYRRRLQDLGQALYVADNRVWLNLLEAALEEADARPLVVPNIRRLNEAIAVIQRGGEIVLVRSELGIRMDRIRNRDGYLPDASILCHETEEEIDTVEGTLFELGYAVECVDNDREPSWATDRLMHILKERARVQQ